MAKRTKWWLPQPPPDYHKDYVGPLGTEHITFADRAFWRDERIDDCWLNALHAHDNDDPAPLAALVAKGPVPPAVRPYLVCRQPKPGVRPTPDYDRTVRAQVLALAVAEVIRLRDIGDIVKYITVGEDGEDVIERDRVKFKSKDAVTKVSKEWGIPYPSLWKAFRGKDSSITRMRQRREKGRTV